MSRETRIWLFVLGALFIIFGICEARAQDASPPAPVPPAQASEPANNAPVVNNNATSQDVGELMKQNDALVASCKKTTDALQADRTRKNQQYNPLNALSDMCDRLEKDHTACAIRHVFWRECVGDVSIGDRAKLDAFATALDKAAGEFIARITESKRLLRDRFDGARLWMDDPTREHFWGWDSDHFCDVGAILFPDCDLGEMQGVDAVALRNFRNFRQELLDAQAFYTMKAAEVLRFVNAELQRTLIELQPLRERAQAAGQETTAPASFPPAKEEGK